MADPISTERFVRASPGARTLTPRPVAIAQLLDRLLGLQVALRQCNAFAALSTEAFGIVRAMVGPSMCTFLTILHQPQTPEPTKREMRGYLSGFLTGEELDGLGEDELCAWLLRRLRAQGFPVEG